MEQVLGRAEMPTYCRETFANLPVLPAGLDYLGIGSSYTAFVWYSYYFAWVHYTLRV